MFSYQFLNVDISEVSSIEFNGDYSQASALSIVAFVVLRIIFTALQQWWKLQHQPEQASPPLFDGRPTEWLLSSGSSSPLPYLLPQVYSPPTNNDSRAYCGIKGHFINY